MVGTSCTPFVCAVSKLWTIDVDGSGSCCNVYYKHTYLVSVVRYGCGLIESVAMDVMTLFPSITLIRN